MIVDSHCHLNYFSDVELDGLITKAASAGVMLMQTICTTMDEFPVVLDIANRYKQVYASVGVHPCNASKGECVSEEALVGLSKDPKVIGFGETGLDFYKCDKGIKEQEKNFVAHISASRDMGLPVIIHSRDADERMADILASEMKLGEFKGLMHCFSSSVELAKKVLDLGLYISFSGILTFKNAESLRAVASLVPHDRVVVETDSPFLCPVPHRGERNHPAMTRFVVERLSQLWGESFEVVSEVTTRNFFRLFDKCFHHYHGK